MVKFNLPDPNEPIGPVNYPQQPSMPIQPPITSYQPQNNTATIAAIAEISKAQASVGLAEVSIDNEILQDSIKKEDEHWVKAYWRPGIAILYAFICFMDFVVFPVLAMSLPLVGTAFGLHMNYIPWQPLTVSGGGLFHLSFGAIVGGAVYTHGKEKLAGI